MKNFTIILFIFFILFLLLSLYANELVWLFITLVLALTITVICLGYYLGFGRGLIIIGLLIVLPFVCEYILYRFNLPIMSQPIISRLSLSELYIPVTMSNFFYVVTVPLLFMSGLIFSQKIKIYFGTKKYHKTFIVICSSLLLAFNFLLFANNQFVYTEAVKWLIISLIVYTLISRLVNFKGLAEELYKELPIILYLAIYGANALRGLNTINLFLTLILICFYLLILYNEYKIRKISQQV